MCDKSHQHKRWGFSKKEGGFATAEERQYPELFCARLAKLVKQQLAPEVPAQVKAAMRQPRRSPEALVAEWCWLRELDFQGTKEELQAHIMAGRSEVPRETKVIAVLQDGGISGQSSFKVGLHWTKQQFIARAMTVQHPFDRELVASPANAASWMHMVQVGPKVVSAGRMKAL
eukprot:10525023-Karenia_brevis.AAC.1